MSRARLKHPGLTTFPSARHLRWRADGKMGALVRPSIYLQNSFTGEASSQGSNAYGERIYLQNSFTGEASSQGSNTYGERI
jgi:hypothetical protein